MRTREKKRVDNVRKQETLPKPTKLPSFYASCVERFSEMKALSQHRASHLLPYTEAHFVYRRRRSLGIKVFLEKEEEKPPRMRGRTQSG